MAPNNNYNTTFFSPKERVQRKPLNSALYLAYKYGQKEKEKRFLIPTLNSMHAKKSVGEKICVRPISHILFFRELFFLSF